MLTFVPNTRLGTGTGEGLNTLEATRSSVVWRGAPCGDRRRSANLIRAMEALRPSPSTDPSNEKQAEGWRTYGGVALLRGLVGFAGEYNRPDLLSIQIRR